MGKKTPMPKVTDNAFEVIQDVKLVKDITNTTFLKQMLDKATILINNLDDQLTDIGSCYKELEVETLNKVAQIYNVVERDISNFKVRIDNIRKSLNSYQETDIIGGIELTNSLRAIMVETESIVIPNLKDMNTLINKGAE